MKKLIYLLFFLISQATIAQSYHFDILKDINDRTQDSDIRRVATIGGKTLFMEMTYDSNTVKSYMKFWKTDGVTIENYATKEFSQYGHLTELYTYNNKFYFGSSNDSPRGLWVTDLTEAGTRFIIHHDSDHDEFIGFNNKIFYYGERYADGNYTYLGNELMCYDETQNTSYVVKDINVGYDESEVRNLTVVNDKLFFRADDIVGNTELWVSDGTTNGTHKVKEINAGENGTILTTFAKLGNKLIFQALYNIDGYYLYTSDGTEAGTIPFKKVSTFSQQPYYGVTIKKIYSFGNNAIIILNESSTDQIWITDGTDANTKFIAFCDKYGYSDGSDYKNILVQKDGFIFYSWNNKLYKTDGNSNILLKQFAPGESFNGKMVLKMSSGTLLFQSLYSVYETDGTATGTFLVKKIFPNSVYSDIVLGAAGNKTLAYLTPNYKKYGKEIYEIRSDTVKIFKDLNPLTGSSEHWFLLNQKGKTYFTTNDDSGRKIFVTDGTLEGTKSVNSVYSSERTFASIKNGQYIVGGNTVQKIDFNLGTNTIVKTLPSTANFSQIQFTENKFYFTTVGYYYGTNDLWESDGTEAGTKVIMTSFNGFQLFATKNDIFAFIKNSNSLEVWHSKETESTLTLTKSFISGVSDSFKSIYAGLHGKIAYLVNIANVNSLWLSDGTTTTLIQDNFPELANTNDLVFTNNFYYYSIYSSSSGTQVWKSDGTGISLLANFPDAKSRVLSFSTCQNNVFFILQREMQDTKYYMYRYDINNGNINLITGNGVWNLDFMSNFKCLQEKMVFTLKDCFVCNYTNLNSLYISDGNSYQLIAPVDKLIGGKYYRGIHPLNDKELLVSVDDKFYDLEWFTFRICDNPNNLSGSTTDSKIQSSPTTITSTEKLIGDNRVYYFAPLSITLSPGFSVDNSGIFKAEIKERTCSFRNP